MAEISESDELDILNSSSSKEENMIQNL